jgi:D-alanyl-D-alanine endopeptidase (penicillin-binding protein 7)
MRWLTYLFVSVLFVFCISRSEWDCWSRDANKQKAAHSIRKNEIPLQTVRTGQSALESHKLPLRSEAAVVLDTRRGEVLFKKNMEMGLPIASLTKLMSALVFLETNPDLDNSVTITVADAKRSERYQLRVGETFTLRDILHSSLLSSSNRAARALARASGLSRSEFVTRMNRKAGELGLKSTFFCEPTGLDEKNRSTALDCAKLLYFVLQDSVIASIFSRTTYEFVSLDEEKRRHQIGSTSKLLFASLNVKGGKSGHNGASGWCLGTLVEAQNGEEMAAVILGAPSKQTRFKEIRSIVEWCIEKNKKGS